MRESTPKKFSVRLAFSTVLLCIFLSSTSLLALQGDQSPNVGPPLLLAHAHIEHDLPLPNMPAVRPERDSINLQVTEARLYCSDNSCSHHEDCALEIQYRLSSVLRGNHKAGAQIMCKARLDYTTSHGYELQSERCSKSGTHHFRNHDRIDATIVVAFQFSPYEQVIEAKVGSIQCSIEQATILHSELTAD